MILRRIKKAAVKGADAKERSLWADLLALGMVFPIAIVAGLFLGRWIGGKFGRAELGQWIGLAWGVAAGFWELFKTSQKLDRFDASNAREAKEAEAARKQTPLASGEDGGDSEDGDRGDRPRP